MKAGVLSAGVFGIARPARRVADVMACEQAPERTPGWNADRFGCDQVRGLVRQVFDPSAATPIRQVVFGAVGPEADVRSICRKAGEALAAETFKDVAVVIEDSALRGSSDRNSAASMRSRGSRILANLWVIPLKEDLGTHNGESLHAYLGQIRREFDYSIVGAPSDAGANETAVLGRFADGLILVLSAMRTRRASALKFREALSQVRLLGTVLSDREFPIPERIYRRL